MRKLKMPRFRWRRFVRRSLTLLGRPLQPLIGFSFALIVFGTSVFGNYIVTLFLPMITFGNRHRQWRELMDRAITFWMLIPLFFLHYVYRVKVRATGDIIQLDEPAVIIMNHRTRLDWLYFWLVLWRINPWLMTTNKIALKQFLRHVPGAGFGMQASMYVFLKRDFETDTARMSRAVDYYSDMQRPYQILMFPEGTDKTDHTTSRSDQYAKRKGLRSLRHLLYPRTAGFVHLVKKMRERNYFASIYDVTVAYPGDSVQNETDMILKGKLASRVHYDIRRIPADQIPSEDEQLNQWIIDLWQEKDQKLEKYYAQVPRNRKLDPSGDKGLWLGDDFRQMFVKAFGFFFWISVVPVWLYHLRFLLFVQVGFVFLMLNYLVIYGFYGGIDELIMSQWERHKRKTRHFASVI